MQYIIHQMLIIEVVILPRQEGKIKSEIAGATLLGALSKLKKYEVSDVEYTVD